MPEPHQYCNNLNTYSRRQSIEVYIGDIPLGGDQPIRIQSMTTTNTLDTRATVEQSIRMIEAGSEYVRITAPSINESENLRSIKNELISRGYKVPIIADIHFTPNAAELAARIVEKVRINPGNYSDKKKFKNIEYTDASYEAEIERIRERFLPLVKICKENGTAMRIGTNHGSLSDRIMSRYGDTPLGMVESALEFLRICQDESYDRVVLSMKASNTRVMVQAYRLLVSKLEEAKMPAYPLHLGVTEAGEGEDGRIKSAVGIGALLEEGLGDTIRVSLTEEPEYEIPVARTLVDRYSEERTPLAKEAVSESTKNPFTYSKRETKEINNIGGTNVPRVISDLRFSPLHEVSQLKSLGHHYLPEPDKWVMTDLGAEYVLLGDQVFSFMLPNGLQAIVNLDIWQGLKDKRGYHPLFTTRNYAPLGQIHFVWVDVVKDHLPEDIGTNAVLIVHASGGYVLATLRNFILYLMKEKIRNPVIIHGEYGTIPGETMQLYAATDLGGLLIDGLGDGILISHTDLRLANSTAFGVLQAARTRMTKTEYISCPSCGRTLFDLQETTAMIRQRTDHLKGVKIGVMGCIVNGPGEMADADYGYVGSGKDKITLYKGQELVKRNIPSEGAVEELIELIKSHGDWLPMEEVN